MAVTLPTVDDLRTRFQQAVQALRPELTDFETGSTLDALAWAVALVGDEVLGGAVRLTERLFFSTTDRDALVALIQDRYGDQITIQGETPARGRMRLTRATTGAGDVLVSAGQVFTGPGTELEFEADGPVLLSGLTVDVAVTCSTLGPAGNLTAGSLNAASPALSDGSIVVSQPERMAGGADEETLEELRALVRLFWTGAQKATVDALVFGARQVAGVRVAVVDETTAAPEDGGYITVSIGDADGEANAELIDAVDAELVDWVAAGVVWQVAAVERSAWDVEVTLRLSDLTALGDLVALVQDALVVWSRTLQPGDGLYISQLERVSINVDPADRGGVIVDADVRVRPDAGAWSTADQAGVAGTVPRLETTRITVRGV